jgi:hypothetical protein
VEIRKPELGKSAAEIGLVAPASRRLFVMCGALEKSPVGRRRYDVGSPACALLLEPTPHGEIQAGFSSLTKEPVHSY